MNYVGDFPTNGVVYLLWNTNDQAGASITRSTDGTLKIYKNVSATERTSLAGVTQVEDFDGNTGVHSISIDLSDNTDAGFYAAGNSYHVVMVGMVIDTKTVNAQIAHFSIERAGGALALAKGTSGFAAISTKVIDLIKRGFNRLDITDATGAYTLYDDNSTTPLYTGTITDNSTTTSRSKMA